MDLNKLKTFLVVAEQGSVTQAAELLSRTQPAISLQLKQLEKSTGLTLFDRKHGKIYLTREGQQLYAFAAPKVQAIEEQPVLLRQALAEVKGWLRIGVNYLFGQALLARIIRTFQQTYPQVRFELVDCTHQDLEQALIQNQVDLALTTRFPQPEFFESVPVFYYNRTLAASREYISKAEHRLGHAIAVEDLPELAIIESSKEMRATYAWLKSYAPEGLSALPPLTPYLVTNNVDVYHDWIQEGAGMGLVSGHILDLKHSAQMQLVFPDSQPQSITLGLSRRKNHNLGLAEQAFWQFMIEQMQGFLKETERH